MSRLSAYAGKRVLVTGHTGFKGAWMCLLLERLGAEVTGFSLPPPTETSLYEDAQVADGMTSIIGDVRDLDAVRDAVERSGAEYAFHLAAQPLVRRAHAEPLETFSTNVMGTVNFLEAFRASKTARSIVVITTDKVYSDENWVWGYRETDRLGGHEPYSASKAAAELATDAYRQSYFRDGRCGIATARAGNVIGGGDWAVDRIVPDIIRSAIAKTPVEIRSPQATRPWQHVLDPLVGYLLLGLELAEDPKRFSEGFNFGPVGEPAMPVWDLAQRVAKSVGVDLVDASDRSSGPTEALTLVLDSSLAANRLRWTPLFRFEQAADLTAAWYREWLRDRSRARAITDEHIRAALEGLSA